MAPPAAAIGNSEVTGALQKSSSQARLAAGADPLTTAPVAESRQVAVMVRTVHVLTVRHRRGLLRARAGHEDRPRA